MNVRIDNKGVNGQVKEEGEVSDKDKLDKMTIYIQKKMFQDANTILDPVKLKKLVDIVDARKIDKEHPKFLALEAKMAESLRTIELDEQQSTMIFESQKKIWNPNQKERKDKDVEAYEQAK